VVWAYYDESGEYAGGGPLVRMTIGGCVSTLEKWQNFEEKWSSILSEEGLCSFHMAYFEAWEPPFDFKLSNGQRDRERHNRLLNRLLEVMVDNIEGFHGFTSYDVPKEGRKAHREAMEQCTVGAISHAIRSVAEHYRQPVNLVFAKQKHFPEPGRRHWQRYYDVKDSKIGTRTEADANSVVQLQAADLFAYEMARHVRVGRPNRYPFQQLQKGIKSRGGRLTLQVGPFKRTFTSSTPWLPR
jgi:hypothetical protein